MAKQLPEVQGPLPPLLGSKQTYPLATLGNLLRPAAERMADVIGVPCAMASQSVLATAPWRVRRTPMSTSTDKFLLTVACSGDRAAGCTRLGKTAVDRLWRTAQGTPRCDEHHRKITYLEKSAQVALDA